MNYVLQVLGGKNGSWFSLFLGLCCSSCVSPPIEAPISQVGKVYVVANSSGRDLGGAGLEPSAIGAAEQAFTEVLLKRGYRVVKRDGAQSTKECTHYFEVTVNQAFVEQGASKKYVHINVTSKLIELSSKEVIMARSLPPREQSTREAGILVGMVAQMAQKVAMLYPPATLPALP